jgi:hypothetical protein
MIKGNTQDSQKQKGAPAGGDGLAPPFYLKL